MRCPVCRAENGTATCRRCRADLSPLFALEADRQNHLAAAALAADQRDADAVVMHAEAAHRLRHGPDALRWQGLGHLLSRNYAAAWRCYLQQREQQPRS